MKKLFKLFKKLFVKKCQCINCYGQEDKHSDNYEFMNNMYNDDELLYPDNHWANYDDEFSYHKYTERD